VAEALQAARKVPARLQIEPVEVLVTPHDLLVYALGATQVYREERLVAAADWSYAKPRELLFYFMANPPRTKEQVGLVFWPDASPAQLRRNFRAALYHLRQALGRREWVLYEEGRYGFNRSLDYWYDVEAFERGWAAAQKLAGVDPEQAAEMLSDTLELYRGEYLEDVGLDDWAVLRREELHEMFLTAQARQGQWLFDSQQYEAAAAAFRALLAHDNLLESAHRALMRCYARLGQRNLALRHYADLVDLLDAELGAAPAPETLALYEQLQAGQPL
jgi:DNA-binding SARP family transcriptional activator